MMDEFFTSKHKKPFIPTKEVTEALKAFSALNWEARKELTDSLYARIRKGELLTRTESIILKRNSFMMNMRRKAKVHWIGHKKILRAIDEYHAGKRDRVIVQGGYGTTSPH